MIELFNLEKSSNPLEFVAFFKCAYNLSTSEIALFKSDVFKPKCKLVELVLNCDRVDYKDYNYAFAELVSAVTATLTFYCFAI